MPVGARQRKGHHVQASAHQPDGRILVHAKPAGGGGYPHPARRAKGREVEKAGMQQRFAPTLKMGPEAATQQGPQGRDHLGRHGARAPYPRPEWYGGSKCNAPEQAEVTSICTQDRGRGRGQEGVAQLPPEAGPEGRFIQWSGRPLMKRLS